MATMRDDEIWLKANGTPLTLGLKVTISESSAYYGDYRGIHRYITGLVIERDGASVNISIGEYMGQLESDGWNIHDIELARG